MKRILLIAASLALVSASIAANDARDIYKKYAGKDNVDAVFISSAMFRLINAMPMIKSASTDDFDFSPVIKSLTGMYILDSQNAEINGAMAQDIEALISSKDYELLMEAHDSDEKVQALIVGTDSTVEKFLLFVTGKNNSECTFISMEGKIPRDKLEAVIAKGLE